jgi:Ca2+-binding EF-hand superfamily protein
MVAKLQQRIEKEFEKYDTNGDGKIVRADINNVLWSLCVGFEVGPDSNQWQEITVRANKLWQEIEGHLNSNGEKEITMEEWVAAHQVSGFVENIAIPLALATFALVDCVGAGKVSLNDWMAAQAILGASEIQALEEFHRLDINKDGFISANEYSKAANESYGK